LRELGRAGRWLALCATGLLAVLSVAGAFLGDARAAEMFNSAPLAVFWVALAVLLLTAILWRTVPGRSGGVLVALAGVVLVLLGGMWGSRAASAVLARLSGTHRLSPGIVVAVKGEPSDDVVDRQTAQPTGKLPFSLKLLDFRVVRYPPSATGEQPPAIRNYESDVAVIRDGREVARCVISVNHPLHFGDYGFYQWSYDPQQLQYTVLLTRSDAGRLPVFAGFALLCAGVFWACWKRPLWAFLTRQGRQNGA